MGKNHPEGYLFMALGLPLVFHVSFMSSFSNSDYPRLAFLKVACVSAIVKEMVALTGKRRGGPRPALLVDVAKVCR